MIDDGIADIIELKPRIRIGVDEMRVNDEAIAALRRDPRLYNRAGHLVRLNDDDPAAMPTIQFLPKSNLREQMANAARWEKFSDKAGWISSPPPTWSVDAVNDRGTWEGIRRLKGITTAPTMRPDGTILDRAGYDLASGLIFAPRTTFPPVPAEPNGDEVQAAVDALLDPLVDFPFREPADRAAAVSVVLSIVGRPAIAGQVPLYAMRARSPGTGKSLLAELAVIAATGIGPEPKTAPPDEDKEWAKFLLAIALETPPVVMLDNIIGSLGAGPLSAALTTGKISERILGTNVTGRGELRSVWIATGNNIGFKAELARRVIAVDMESDLENPEDRTGFKYSHVRDHVTAIWPSLAVAALTILRGYHLAGRPHHGGQRLGSFETWDELVRGALVWAGVGDPDGARGRLREEADQDRDELRGALVAWATAFGQMRVTCAEVMEKVAKDAELAAALSGLVTGHLTAKRIGVALRRFENRPVGGMRIESYMGHNNTKRWHVAAFDPTSSPAAPHASLPPHSDDDESF